MRIRGKIVLGAVFLLLLPLVCSCAKKTVNLEYRFTKGEELRYTMTLKGDGTTRIDGLPGQVKEIPEKPLKMQMDFAYKMVVKDVDAQGSADIETYLDSFKSVTDSGGLKMQMEVDEKGARMMQGDTVVKDAPGLENMTELFKTPTTIKMDKRGNVISVSEPGGAGIGLPQTDFYSFIKQAQFTLPEGPVAVGHSWKDKRDLMLGDGIDKKVKDSIDLKLDVTYTLKGLVTREGRQCAEISMRGAMKAKDMEMDMQQVKGSPVAIKIVFDKLVQDIDGKIYFDFNDGLMVATQFDIDQDMVMTMNMAKGDQEFKLKSNVKMKLTADIKLAE